MLNNTSPLPSKPIDHFRRHCVSIRCEGNLVFDPALWADESPSQGFYRGFGPDGRQHVPGGLCAVGDGGVVVLWVLKKMML